MGVVLMLLSSASFATMSAMVKGLGTDIPLQQMVFLRCVLAIPILLAVVIIRERPLLVKARKLILIRTILGMSAMYCFFFALTHMPLADCVFIGRTQPLLIALFAPFVVGEKAPRAAWIAIGCGIAGVILIMKPAIQWPVAAWIAIAAALLSAGAHLMVRRLNRTDYPLVIVFNFTVLTAMLTSFWALPGFEEMSSRQWLLVAGIAIFASLGQILMTSAYGKDRAPTVAAASYSSVVLSVIYGYLFWGEIPQALAWVGGLLIILGGLQLVFSRTLRAESAR